ncbi:Phenylalanine--tRNA ligase beta subunit, partial [Frankliniella fusca]
NSLTLSNTTYIQECTVLGRRQTPLPGGSGVFKVSTEASQPMEPNSPEVRSPGHPTRKAPGSLWPPKCERILGAVLPVRRGTSSYLGNPTPQRKTVFGARFPTAASRPGNRVLLRWSSGDDSSEEKRRAHCTPLHARHIMEHAHSSLTAEIRSVLHA